MMHHKMNHEMTNGRSSDEPHHQDGKATVHCDRYLEGWTHAISVTLLR
jgi:hypothetical protein